MQQVRLLLEFFDPDSFQFLNSCLSDVITNSKSKECGPLQVETRYDDADVGQHLCY